MNNQETSSNLIAAAMGYGLKRSDNALLLPISMFGVDAETQIECAKPSFTCNHSINARVVQCMRCDDRQGTDKRKNSELRTHSVR